MALKKHDLVVNLLQFSCGRFTGDDPAAASRQLRLAKWLVSDGSIRERTTPPHLGKTAKRIQPACRSRGMPGKDRRTVREIAARKKDRRYVSALPPHGGDARP